MFPESVRNLSYEAAVGCRNGVKSTFVINILVVFFLTNLLTIDLLVSTTSRNTLTSNILFFQIYMGSVDQLLGFFFQQALFYLLR